MAEPHFETNVFGVWLLLLALAALTARSEPARTRALAVFGLLAGLAAWTSLKVVAVLGPVWMLLGAPGPAPAPWAWRRRFWRADSSGQPPGLALLHRPRVRRPAGQSLSVGYLFRSGVDLSLTRLREFWTDVILRPAGNLLLATRTRPLRRSGARAELRRSTSSASASRWASSCACAAEPSRAPEPGGSALLLLTLAASLGAVYVSRHAGTLSRETSRYALPAYIPLLVCTGALVVEASRWSRTVGAGLLAFLLLFAGWTNGRFFWPLSPAMRARQAESIASARACPPRSGRATGRGALRRRHHARVRLGLPPGPSHGFVDGQRRLRPARGRDGRGRADRYPGRVGRGSRGRRPRGGWRHLGATSILGWRLFENVRAPGRRYRMVPRSAWRVMGDPNVPASIADGDLATAWPRPARMARSTRSCWTWDVSTVSRRVVFWPSQPTSTVFPLRVSGSGDGLRWETFGTVPAVARQPDVRGQRPASVPAPERVARARPDAAASPLPTSGAGGTGRPRAVGRGRAPGLRGHSRGAARPGGHGPARRAAPRPRAQPASGRPGGVPRASPGRRVARCRR